MAVCSKCGKKIPAGSKFCPTCGAPVIDDVKSEKTGTRKCPSCGAVLSDQDTVCPYCGFKFDDSEIPGTVDNFTKELIKLEADVQRKNGIKGLFGTKKTANEKLVSFIRNFSVPETKEEIYKFMLFASAKINPKVFSAKTPGDIGAKNESELASIKERNAAWLAKIRQTYEKAKALFGNDADFVNIQQIYDNTMKSVRSAKKKKLIFSAAVVAVLLALIIVPFSVVSINHGSRERKLEKTVQEIQTDISAGKYDDALIKAETLHMDDNWSDESKEHWDEERESLIKLIKDKQKEAENRTD